MKIELNCAVCGNNRFTLNEADSDDSVISCEECEHALGTLGELKDRVAAEVVRRSLESSSKSAEPPTSGKVAGR